MFVDSHCHLNLLAKKDDLEQIILRAKSANISHCLSICTHPRDLDEILQLIEPHNNIFSSVGMHPCDVDKIVGYHDLVNLSQHPKIIGFGETGLDYYHPLDNPEQQIKLQKDSFLEHIYASQLTQLPIIIHTRSVDADTIDLVSQNMKFQKFPGLIHCFTSTKELAFKMLDLGLYISVSGIITFNSAQDIRDIIQQIPIKSLLVETDSPYLAPVPLRGKVNEPANVAYVVGALAALKNISVEECAHTTSDNFFKLFGKAIK